MKGGEQLGKLKAIWIKRMRRGPMDVRDSVDVLSGRGLKGNANQGGKRQVTLIETECWADMMRELGAALDPSARRANLLLEGVRLQNSRGRVLRVGGCRIAIHGETRPCERMEEALPGLQTAMSSSWRGGAYGEVLNDGRIQVGDEVEWESILGT